MLGRSSLTSLNIEQARKMRSSVAHFLLFSILLLANAITARRDPEAYWKDATKGEAMPKAIKDLVLLEHNQDEKVKSKYKSSSHFVKDFDTTPVNIIYRKHYKTKN